MTAARTLVETAQSLVAEGKGLLAMDESNPTCDRRFQAAGVPQTVAMRRAYRALLLSTPGLGSCISGVILYDETIHQGTESGRPLPALAREAGLLVGIKVDTGARALAAHAGEQVTEGLDGLRERLMAYRAMGASFAKWRGVIAVDGPRLPSPACVDANAHALARYAALCQEAGLVPIVEPEVLLDGAHGRERCAEVTETVLRRVFTQLARQGVMLEALILKPNMVTSGAGCTVQDTAIEVANATLQCMRRVVPAAVAGIAFLSGGQSGAQASSRLNAMHAGRHAGADEAPHPGGLPWPVTFSFARALQHPALDIWAGQEANRASAQQALLHRAQCNSAALRGAYAPDMETR